jgi:hypothetical protein
VGEIKVLLVFFFVKTFFPSGGKIVHSNVNFKIVHVHSHLIKVIKQLQDIPPDVTWGLTKSKSLKIASGSRYLYLTLFILYLCARVSKCAKKRELRTCNLTSWLRLVWHRSKKATTKEVYKVIQTLIILVQSFIDMRCFRSREMSH